MISYKSLCVSVCLCQLVSDLIVNCVGLLTYKATNCLTIV